CAIELAKTKGVRRAIPLSVSAPFHCALMAPAAKRMAEALAKIDIKKPKVPVVANVLAAPVEDPREIRERLVEQVTGTVRWRESVVFMAGRGVSEFIELGSGKVLTGLLKRIVETATGIAVGTPDEIKAYQAFC
ncbi:MAG: ACP S-malonyltransferase, partial [Methylovirgula sp.]